jgi:hypothetical protein
MTTRVWYLVAAGLMISAATMAILAYGQMTGRVEGMQRVAMPGRAEITMPAGTSTLYVERTSRLGGKTYDVTGELEPRCAIDERQGRKVTLTTPKANVMYAISGFAGKNTWDLDVMAPGSYTLVCEAGQPFVIAIGQGIGAWIVVAAVGVVPFLIGAVIIAIVFFKRRGQKKRLARAAPPAA